MTIFQPKLVMIDVDGTLVDSVPDLAYCVDQMMLSLDMPVRGEEAVRHWVGNGVPRLVERALTGELDGSPGKEAFDKAYPIFLDLYSQNSSVRSTLYEGVMEGLDYLKSKGVQDGDRVFFTPDSEYEFNVDGEKLYRMYDHQITIKL